MHFGNQKQVGNANANSETLWTCRSKRNHALTWDFSSDMIESGRKIVLALRMDMLYTWALKVIRSDMGIVAIIEGNDIST